MVAAYKAAIVLATIKTLFAGGGMAHMIFGKSGASTVAKGITQVGMAGMRAAPGLLALGGAVALVGAGIGAAGFGLSKFVGSLGGFMNGISLEKLGKLNVALSSLSLTFGLLATSLGLLVAASPGLLVVDKLARDSGLGGVGSGNNSGQAISVNMPEEKIKLEIKMPIYLDKKQIGEVVQEQILTRENRLLPGRLQSNIGIKTG